MPKLKTYIYHTDPGHGWFAVRKAEIRKLGIADKITAFSYVRGDTVYLEEDLDAATWFEAYEKIHGVKPEYRYSHQDRTPIRYYQRYTAEAI